MDKKLKFLVLELQDIKNNKGSVTMQMRSIEHLQTWLKRDPKLSSELLIKPLEVSLAQVQRALKTDSKAWWKDDGEAYVDDENLLEQWRKPTDWKSGSKVSNEVQSAAKKHHMITDVKKAVFQAIVQSEDYLQAFESLNRLNLKKTQQREIIRVLVHCCLGEQTYNAFYALVC
jgi:nucleolar MIF4G domain-containing protein 1